MFASIQDALAFLSDGLKIKKHEERLQAYAFLAQHADELTHRVYVDMPRLGVTVSESFLPMWNDVWNASQPRCSCGYERLIHPGKPREEFEPSSVFITLSKKEGLDAGEELFLIPVGGDRQSTLVSLQIEGPNLLITDDPFAPLILSPDMFDQKGADLREIDVMWKERGDPSIDPIFMRPFRNLAGRIYSVPIFAIKSLDLETSTMVIELDASIEVYRPDFHVKHACV